MCHCRPSLELCLQVILGREEVAEVAQEVVEDISLIAFPQSVQVYGRLGDSQSQKLRKGIRVFRMKEDKKLF